MIKNFIKFVLTSFGYQVSKINPNFISYPKKKYNEGLLNEILTNKSTSLVIDVGANCGDWAIDLRSWGYRGRILSFEPLTTEFNLLAERSHKDLNWEALNLAVGDGNYNSEINISNNSVSSSLSQILPDHIEAESSSKTIGQQSIEIVSLDEYEHSWVKSSDSIFIKIDVQGFEKKVLDGALNLLGKTALIQLELSFNPLYSDDVCFNEMKLFLKEKGFLPYHIQNGFRHSQTGELLQIDVLFINQRFSPNPLNQA